MNVGEALQGMPQAIRELDNRLWDHKVETEDLRLKSRLIEGDVEAWAASPLDDGSKRFPNEAIRNAQARAKLAGHEEHRRILDVVRGRLQVEQRMGSTLAYYEAVQKNARALALSTSVLDLDFKGDA